MISVNFYKIDKNWQKIVTKCDKKFGQKWDKKAQKNGPKKPIFPQIAGKYGVAKIG